MMSGFPRTWTAGIVVRDKGQVRSIEATPSRYDLLRDQTISAVDEAIPFLSDTADVHVVLFKTTKARGTEEDRSFYVRRDRDGLVRYAR